MTARGSGDKQWTKEKIKERIEENELDLSLCSISKVPVSVILPFTKITVLDLSCNKINTLPENFSKLQQLLSLDLSKNGITELPADFGELTKLRKLDLFNNNLDELPLSFCRLKQLQWLDLKSNPIQEKFPKLVGDCLKPAECQACAKNIVAHYSNVYGEQLVREKREKKLEADRLAKEKEEENQVRQRRKEEKKKRLAEQKLKQQELKNAAANSNGDLDHGDEDTADDDAEPMTASGSTSFCMKLFYFLLLMFVTVPLFFAISNGIEHEWDVVLMEAHIKKMVEKSFIELRELRKKYEI